MSWDTPATSLPRSWIVFMKLPDGIDPGVGSAPAPGRRLAVASPQDGAGAAAGAALGRVAALGGEAVTRGVAAVSVAAEPGPLQAAVSSAVPTTNLSQRPAVLTTCTRRSAAARPRRPAGRCPGSRAG